jgi:hypothetical protein
MLYFSKYGKSLYNINKQNPPSLNNILFLICLIYVSSRKVHLQEEGYTYRYGTFIDRLKLQLE